MTRGHTSVAELETLISDKTIEMQMTTIEFVQCGIARLITFRLHCIFMIQQQKNENLKIYKIND